MNIGLAGRFQVKVYRADGTLKMDTGEQDNLILNKGLDFLGSGEGHMMYACAIGSGSTAPLVTDTKLGAVLNVQESSDRVYNKEYVNDGSGTYTTSQMRTYRFVAGGSMNVSELGLSSSRRIASTGPTVYEYNLCTRALIKNPEGSPITIPLIAGEVLVVYYTLYQVYSTEDTVSSINIVQNSGPAIPTTAITRLARAGTSGYQACVGAPLLDGESITFFDGENKVYTTPLVAVDAALTGHFQDSKFGGWSTSMSEYSSGDYFRIFNLVLDLGAANNEAGVKRVVVYTSMGVWQVQYTPSILKTLDHRLILPIKFSWNRLEALP